MINNRDKLDFLIESYVVANECVGRQYECGASMACVKAAEAACEKAKARLSNFIDTLNLETNKDQ